MEDIAIITALNHSGSFRKNFVESKGKNKNVIHQPRSRKTAGKTAGKSAPS